MEAILNKITELESQIQLLSNKFEASKKETDQKINDMQLKQKHDIKERDHIIKDLQNKCKISSSNIIDVKYIKTSQEAQVPKQGGDDPRNIGYDLWVDKLVSKSKGVRRYSTGIALEPQPGSYIEIQERSSFRIKYPGWVGAIGTIDGGYRGPLHVVMTKINTHAEKLPPRFSCFQIIARPEIFINWIPVDHLSDSIRQNDGFGSTDERKDALIQK